MRKLKVLLCAVSALLFIQISPAQERVRIKQDVAKRMVEARLVLKSGTPIIRSLLYDVEKDHVTMAMQLVGPIAKPVFATKDFAMADIDHMIVYDKKRKSRFKIIGGLAGAALSYFVVNEITNKDLRSASKEALPGQNTNTGFIEPLVAANLGAGIGVILGELLYPVKVDVGNNQSESYRLLRQFQTDDRNAKRKRPGASKKKKRKPVKKRPSASKKKKKKPVKKRKPPRRKKRKRS